MASSSSNSQAGVSGPAVPIFDGEDYDLWCLMMKTLFISQELWELVEKGFSEKEEEAKVRENKKKDAKALFFIQQALSRPILAHIASANTTNEAWTTLKKVVQGNPKVVAVKLQTLRQDFKNLRIKNTETIQNYIARVLELSNQMKGLGDTIPEAMVVGKLLRSLGSKFNHVVTAIEESKDLTKLTMEDVSGSLIAHEARLLRQVDDQVEKEEKAFNVRSEAVGVKDREKYASKGRGRGFSRGRFRGKRKRTIKREWAATRRTKEL
ncbi:uncharacterized protein LOC120265039 [Dioscorea cayenensis subsp. rotundata]|uniref:Uncharacterized protein LOC120265039 n=1 Tax=Dioscorea cayennensis subsp. rotundata TaxID=55577 RepID=A0AB40BNM7_DIOCR|nr:uncharacterized protein LOC120265039 [Dioscorea cayenensis subsp. rotundata]